MTLLSTYHIPILFYFGARGGGGGGERNSMMIRFVNKKDVKYPIGWYACHICDTHTQCVSHLQHTYHYACHICNTHSTMRVTFATHIPLCVSHLWRTYHYACHICDTHTTMRVTFATHIPLCVSHLWHTYHNACHICDTHTTMTCVSHLLIHSLHGDRNDERLRYSGSIHSTGDNGDGQVRHPLLPQWLPASARLLPAVQPPLCAALARRPVRTNGQHRTTLQLEATCCTLRRTYR